MDNDDATIGRIFTRREALRASARAGLGLVAGGLFARSAFAAGSPTTQPHLPLIAAPDLTEGPFFVDEKLNRSDLTSGTTRASVINGLPLLLHFTVYKLNGKEFAPMKDVQVDVWHADVKGVYSDESNPMNHENTSKQTWLRGYQITSEEGLVSFKTIFPGWYRGRTPHIHFKVRQLDSTGKSTKEFTSQLFFHEQDIDRIYAKQPYASVGNRDTRNDNDNVYTDGQIDGKPAGSVMLLDLEHDSEVAGYSARFPLILSDSNLRSGRGRGRGPGGPGGGGPGGRGGPGGPPPGGDFDGPPGGGFGGPPPRDD